MDNQVIRGFLEGFSDKEFPSTFEYNAHRMLVLEGAQIIVPVLRMTPPALRTMEAGRPIDDMYLRTQRLIHYIAVASSQQGRMVGEQMVIVFRDNDARMRALAAVHSATPGIPYDTVIGALITLDSTERDLLAKYAVSAALLVVGLSELPVSTFQGVATTAMINVNDFVKNKISNSLPELVQRVRNEYLRGQDQLTQDLMIARLGIYHALLHS